MIVPIKIGVAGAGVFGGFHASKIASHLGASLAAVYDIDLARADALASQFGASASDNYAAFLDGLDAVVIACPASAHFSLAEQALKSGLHVFVEKPIALNVDEADALIALADARALVLQVGHQERYVADAAGLLDRNKSPLKIDCVRGTKASGRCEDVSVILDLMVHDIDLIRQLTKSEIESVSAQGDAHEASADILLINGTIVSLKASRRADAVDRRMVLVYDDGVIEFDFINREINNTTAHDLGHALNSADAPLAIRDPLAFGADQFITSVTEKRTPQVTGRDGRGALAWARAIEAAAGIAQIEYEAETSIERMRA